MRKLSDFLRRVMARLYFFIGFSMLLTITASAYIDPATTAMLTQIIAGALISLGLVFGIFRQRIIMFFKNRKVKRLQKQIEKEQSANKTDVTSENLKKELKEESEKVTI
jgi:hypothetical protein